eukprot:jgi/Mesen1/7496/ME000039S06704
MEAARRLQRDLKEVQAEPLPCVTAAPLENDLSQWHCNLKPDDGSYKGITFHVVLQFPRTYPMEPPSVRLCSRLEHPNVFYSWLGTEEHPYICLDMLRNPQHHGEPYTGWSGAYSVQSLLLQLQSFLFAENIPQDNGSTARGCSSSRAVMTASRSARRYKCPACGFSGPEANTNVPRGTDHCDKETSLLSVMYCTKSRPVAAAAQTQEPEGGLRELPRRDGASKRETDTGLQESAHHNEGAAQQGVPGPAEGVEPAGLSALPDDCLVAVLERLDARALVGRGVWLRRQLLCFTTKLTYAEDILGIGLSLELRPASTRPQERPLFSKQPHPRLKSLLGVTSDLTLVSREAYFEHRVRKGVWNAPFEWWLPLLLDEGHASKALPYLKATLHFLAVEPSPPSWADYQAWVSRRKKGGAFDPLVALNIVPKMMNGKGLWLDDESWPPLGRHVTK